MGTPVPEEMKAKAREFLEFFESADGGYYEGGKRHFEVNVKRHSDQWDIDAAIRKKMRESDIKPKFRKEVEKRVRAAMSPERIADVYSSWLGWECECLHDLFKSKGAVQFDAGEPERSYFEHVIPYGFAGRSGGHYLFDLDVSLHDLEDVADGERFDEYEAIHIVNHATRLRNDALWLKEFVRKHVAGLDFQYELEFRVEETITEVMADIQEEIDHAEEVEEAKALTEHIPKEHRDKVLKFIR